MPQHVEADDKGRGEGVDDGHARLDLEAAQPGWKQGKKKREGWGGAVSQPVQTTTQDQEDKRAKPLSKTHENRRPNKNTESCCCPHCAPDLSLVDAAQNLGEAYALHACSHCVGCYVV